MCGIHGVITSKKRESNADDFVKQGFVAGSLRGIDSSGIASVKVDQKDVVFQKLPVPGPMFLWDRYTQRLSSEACLPGTITICHTRSATSGPTGMSEAHPFLVADNDGRELIGVHNGSLTGWSSKKNAKDYKVDSEWALNHIFDEGFDAFEDFSGAFVFVWWDSDTDQVLNIALNDARPLYIAFTADGSMLYASEAGMLYWLAERNSIKLDGKVKKLLAGFWYKFIVGNPKEYSKTELPKPKATVITSNNFGYQNYSRPNHVEAVEKLLATIAGKPTGTAMVAANDAVAAGATPDKPRTYVRADEVLLAKEAGYMRKKGDYYPMWYDDDTKEIFGTFVHADTLDEIDAIVRNAESLKEFVMAEIWVCEIIGLLDDGQRLTAVCTHPVNRRMTAGAAELVHE